MRIKNPKMKLLLSLNIVICTASVWLLLVICAVGLMGCAEKKTKQKVRPENPKTVSHKAAVEKAALEFYQPVLKKKKKQLTPKQKKTASPPSPKKTKKKFTATTPWTKISPPRENNDVAIEKRNAPPKTARVTTASNHTKTVKAAKSPKISGPKKKTIAKKVKIKTARRRPRKDFVATTPWTRLAPPRDYDDSKAGDKKVWKPSADKKSVKKIAKRSDGLRVAKAKIPKPPVKRTVVTKNSWRQWSWPSSQRKLSRSRRGELFPATTPWTQIAPASEKTALQEMLATTAQLPRPPATGHRIACDLRIVRVSDRRVISQASAVATYGNMKKLARILVGEFARDSRIPLGVSVVAVSLRNRQGTEQGLLVAEKMTNHVAEALDRANKFRFVKQVDLRNFLAKEQALESSKTVTDPKLRLQMQHAKYIVVGGIALDDPNLFPSPRRRESNPRGGGLLAKSNYYNH